MNNFLENIEQSANHIETLKTKVLQAKKIRLHSGIEGFNSPDVYGVYKHTGGEPIGVVGDVFEPTNLSTFLDAIQHSVLNSGVNLDLTKLEYKEFIGGSKIAFRLPIKNYEIHSPMVGDTLETALEFRTGFDGKTKMSLGFYSLRLWCSNGAKNWRSDVALQMKNTANNQMKVMYFTNEIINVVEQTKDYVNLLNAAVKRPIVQKDIDRFISEVTGYNVAEYKDLTTRKRNIIDSINGCVAVEMSNTGANMFSLLQGLTRYTTHEVAEKDEAKILFARANDMNVIGHELVYAELN